MGQLPSKNDKKEFKSKISSKKLVKLRFKKKKRNKVKDSKPVELAQNLSETNGINKNHDDIEAIKIMQDQLAFNSDTFVLNQMMMSVQFFGNFERDLYEAIELNRRKEDHKTKCLSKHYKTILLPDRLAEAVDRRVKFVAKHGKFKNQLQPLHTQTLYIIHDNIEITNPGDTTVYSVVDDAPLYKFQIDNPYEGVRRKKVLHHAGYVKLKSFDKITKNEVLNYNSSSDSQYVSGSIKNETEDDGTYGDNEEEDYVEPIDGNVKTNNIFEKKVGYYAASMNSMTPSSSEYDYSYIRALHTHQPLNIFQQKKFLSTVMLPDSCITTVSRFMIHNKEQDQFYRLSTEDDEDSSDERGKVDEKSENENERNSYYYEDKQYLNSKGFLTYFINLFQQNFANDLEITEENLKNATWKGSSVYCSNWEIIPAVSCPWPREANEWIYRNREFRNDPTTKQQFQWPSLEMIEKIVTFGCNLIPQGYAPKTGSNPQRELEWKIVFPEACRYLESRLSLVQVKVFMMTKALLKSFIEPNVERGCNMFTIDHIRNHLFWQCEYNYTAWNEHQLGEALLKFLSTLLQCIKTHRMPDYFIPKRNLLENIPEKVLVDIHKKIYRIVESPVPYVIIAIRNLRYQKNFYPKLKYKRLYTRLLIDDPTKITNPRVEINIDELVHAPSDEEDDKEPPLGTIAYFDRKERRSRRKRARSVRFALDESYVTAYVRKREVEKDIRKMSIESIDTKAVFLKHMEILRRKLIYTLFINQFLEMTKVTLKYQAYDQGMKILKQAERLCTLLIDDKYFTEAQLHLQAIETMRETIERQKLENLQGPELPHRRMNEIDHAAIRYRSYNIIKTKENDINIGEEDKTDNGIEEEIASDDDNDEIYSYHRSVIAQIHATPAQNLERFRHNDDDEDEEDVLDITESIEKLEVNVTAL
ncbi:hypothetical protein PVAND_013253 [Polypedilum vanderplanki]|uniref:Mab-21-like HhH/H2TH-like domain-containing protein n=1 Tax=Polypedilum vanderplanki TaxID=319348 RepID=A0A9J6CPX3_POLVA|nr:hypothetical protein PVAND_013253 [Polypedilum vanderplanki]